MTPWGMREDIMSNSLYGSKGRILSHPLYGSYDYTWREYGRGVMSNSLYLPPGGNRGGMISYLLYRI